MKFVDLKKSLKEKVCPCYSLTGDDMFLLYKSLELIKNQAVPNMPEFNEVIYSENASYSVKDIIESCLAFPIGDSFRVVVVKDCNLKSAIENVKALTEYLKNPNPTACLVFFNSTKNEFVSKIKNLEVVDCNKLSLDLTRKLIAQKCNDCEKSINTDATELLSSYCLNNLARINNELDKIISYVGEEKVITTADIETNVLKELDFESYEFAQAVAMRNGNRAFEILDSLLVKKENVGMVFASLYNQFSRMFLVRVSKRPAEEMARIFATKEFAIKKTKELASNFTKKKLKEIVETVSQKEFEMKMGKIAQSNICENLVFSILSLV